MMSTVTKRWLLLVLNQIGQHGKAHYNELLKELHPISPKSLADALKEMQTSGLIVKNVERGSPVLVEYSLSNSGRGLREAIVPLLKWASIYTGHTHCPILSAI